MSVENEAKGRKGGKGKRKKEANKQTNTHNTWWSSGSTGMPPKRKAGDGAAEGPRKKAKAAPKAANSGSSGAIARPALPVLRPAGRAVRIVSWNVNGLRAVWKTYKDAVMAFVADKQPDGACLACKREKKIEEEAAAAEEEEE